MAKKYSNGELRSKDLDWFFKKDTPEGVRFVHCASFGGYIPDKVNDQQYLLSCQKIVAEHNFIFEEDDIAVQEDNINKILGEQPEKANHTREEEVKVYKRSFVHMARKGFWSYDKFHEPHQRASEDNKYILIAYPKGNADNVLGYHSIVYLDDKDMSLIDIL